MDADVIVIGAGLAATAPNWPGPGAGCSCSTRSPLAAILATGFDYSWFVLTQKIIEKEFALSGTEQNPDLTGKDIRLTLSRVRRGAPAPVEAFNRDHRLRSRPRRSPRSPGLARQMRTSVG